MNSVNAASRSFTTITFTFNLPSHNIYFRFLIHNNYNEFSLFNFCYILSSLVNFIACLFYIPQQPKQILR